MRSYDPVSFSYGAELEFADVDRHAELAGGTWNTQDGSIVNSTGVANDPKGELWPYGGEVNTKPSYSVNDQAILCHALGETLGAVINYRCNLHVHVGVPGLAEDLEALKALLVYGTENLAWVFEHIEPIPEPHPFEFVSESAYQGARRRYRRRLVSHHHWYSPDQYVRMLKANNPEEFHQAEPPRAKSDGRPMWHAAPRAAMNLRQIFETGTIEFRHWPGTLDVGEYASAIEWCSRFVAAALSGLRTPVEDLPSPWMRFPRFKPYEHSLEEIWRLTNVQHNSRRTVHANIRSLAEQGRIPWPPTR